MHTPHGTTRRRFRRLLGLAASLAIPWLTAATATPARADEEFLYAFDVDAPPNWSSPSYAKFRAADSQCPDSGPPNRDCYCHCSTTEGDPCPSSANRHALESSATASAEYLTGTRFRRANGSVFTVPAGFRVTNVQANVLARYDRSGTDRGRQVRLRVRIPSRSEVVSDSDDNAWPQSTQGSDGYFCNWRRWEGHDKDLGALSEAEINALSLGVRAIDDGSGSEELRVKTFRLRVVYERIPIVCGNGIVEQGEDCDGGACCNALCQREPNGTSCDDGSFCNGADACSNGACTQHAGDPCAAGGECNNACDEGRRTCAAPGGTTCGDDGNPCTNDVCSGAGSCQHVPNSNPCDDGIFCNGADTCTNGSCGQHAGDPCRAGAECNNSCNEGQRTCAVPAGTGCTDDGNVCTTDVCDGAGRCARRPNTAACSDGLFCNGADSCANGACSQHAGDPCRSGPACADRCNESSDSCAAPAGTPCSDDGDTCTTDTCNGSGGCSHPPIPGCDHCVPPNGAPQVGPGPVRATIPSTGQAMSLELTSPRNGSAVEVATGAAVQGRCTIGATGPINVVYVVDGSGSTDGQWMQETARPPVPLMDVTGDGQITAADNMNGDSWQGDIMDAEIAGLTALHASLGNSSDIRVGLVAFGGDAVVADMDPTAGGQAMTSPPLVDRNGNGTPDVYEVLRSIDSRDVPNSLIGKFREATFDSNTNYEIALQGALVTLRAMGAGRSVVYFLSDGMNNPAVDCNTTARCTDELTALKALGATVHTVAVGSFADTSDLELIAAQTGGKHVRVSNPGQLSTELPKITPSGIDVVTVNGVRTAVEADGAFRATVPCGVTRDLPIVATCAASDAAHTSLTADVVVACGCTPGTTVPTTTSTTQRPSTTVASTTTTSRPPTTAPTTSTTATRPSTTVPTTSTTTTRRSTTTTTQPDGEEICDNGIDDDGDGLTDLDDPWCCDELNVLEIVRGYLRTARTGTTLNVEARIRDAVPPVDVAREDLMLQLFDHRHRQVMRMRIPRTALTKRGATYTLPAGAPVANGGVLIEQVLMRVYRSGDIGVRLRGQAPTLQGTATTRYRVTVGFASPTDRAPNFCFQTADDLRIVGRSGRLTTP